MSNGDELQEYTYFIGGASKLLVAAARDYKPVAAALQAAHNGRDNLGATRIFVTLGTRRIGRKTERYLETLDNGRGLEGLMRPGDYVRTQAFWKARVDSGDFSKDIFQEPGLDKESPTWKSLQGMVEMIAKSTKSAGDIRTFGMRQTGTLAYMAFAEDEEIFSKPFPELHQQFWGAEATRQPRRVHMLRHFNATALDKNSDTRYYIGASEQKLVDPVTKRELDHGTLVRVLNLHPTKARQLTPAFLVDELRHSFGHDLREGAYQLFFVERIVDENYQSIEPDRVTEIFPPEAQGEVIVDNVEFDTGYGVARLLVYYSPANNGELKIEALHKGIPIFELRELGNLRGTPFTHRDVFGELHLPVWPNEDNVLTPAKDGLLPVVETEALIKATLAFAPTLQEKLKVAQNRAKSRTVKKFTDGLREAWEHAMNNVAFLQGLTLPGGGGAGPTIDDPEGNPPGRGGGIQQTVAVRVVNRHGIPKEGIEVALTRNNRPQQRAVTREKGGYSFGRWLKGTNYVLEYTVPDGMSAINGDRTTPFELTDVLPGHYHTFVLEDNTPAPIDCGGDDRTQTPPTFEWVPLTRPEPYEVMVTYNKVYINERHPYMITALREFHDGNRTPIVSFLSAILAAAMSEVFLPPPGDRHVFQLRELEILQAVSEFVDSNHEAFNLQQIARVD